MVARSGRSLFEVDSSVWGSVSRFCSVSGSLAAATVSVAERPGGGSTSSLDRSFNARFDFYSIELDLLLLLDDKSESSRAFFFLFFARMQNNVYQNCPQFSFSSLLGIFILENLSSVSSDLRINNICNKEKKKMRR